MAKPTPGQPYTTIQGDTLESIATAAYALSSDWPLIADVNSTQVTLTPSTEIPVGTNLIIPIQTEFDQLRQAQLQRGLKNATRRQV